MVGLLDQLNAQLVGGYEVAQYCGARIGRVNSFARPINETD